MSAELLNPRMVRRDDALLEYATERQQEILRAYWEAGSIRAASKLLGINYAGVSRTLRRVTHNAAVHGYAPSLHHTRPVPPGFRLRGTSSLYVKGQDEPALQWVKTTADDEAREAMLREMAASFCEELPREKPVPVPATSDSDLCAVYPVGDHHFGMYAWNEEAGGDYDLDTAESLLASAFDFLVGSTGNAAKALVVFLGDLMHYDTLESLTPANKNLLDADGRYAKMVRVAIRSVRRAVALAARKHAEVRVVVQAGNHDPSSSVMLAEALAAIYENEPRVSVDTSPCAYHYYRHGRCLIGICHGHEAKKLDRLPLLMAKDRPEDWGGTVHRYWYTGHIHQDRVLDVEGTRVESFRVLPPTDAWAHTHGYRGGREMKALVLHSEYGEVLRVSFRPEMLGGSR